MKADRVPRAALLVAAAVLAALAVVHLRHLASGRAELVRTAQELALTDAELARSLRMTDDPAAGRVALARSALVQALAERAPERRHTELAEARRMAREVLRRRPGAWDAAMVTGAATYLQWSMERDPRLLQEYRAWEGPLELAHRLAPGKEEPERYLATAYLELWPALSGAKREVARGLLATAFRDPRTFARLVDPWLEATGGDLEPVPDTPWAWDGLAQALARRLDWTGYCQAWAMRRDALEDGLRRRLAEALDRVARGDLLSARTELFAIVAEAPRDRRFAPIVDQALKAAPFGPAPADAAAALLEWLEWTQETAERGPLPLSPAAVARLRGAVAGRGTGPGGVGALTAWAALAVGDLPRAERIERTAAETWSDDWVPYRIEKARVLTRRGRLDEAAAALDQVPSDQRATPAFLETRLALADAEGRAEEVSRLRGELGKVTAAAWPATAWTWQQSQARLELLAGSAAPALTLGVLDAPAEGAAIETTWDGEAVACRAVAPDRRLELDIAVTPGDHLLQISSLAGGVVRPGRVALAGPERPPRLRPGSRE